MAYTLDGSRASLPGIDLGQATPSRRLNRSPQANQISESRMMPSPFGAKVQNSRRLAGLELKVKGK
jgi:hypothetical protein